MPTSGNATTAYKLEIKGPESLWDVTEELYFHDVTGDQLADIIKYDAAKGEVRLLVNQDGHQFACYTDSCVVGNVFDDLHGTADLGPHRITFADVNADSVDVVVVLANAGVFVGTIMKASPRSEQGGSGPRPGLLTRIHNGYGATTDIQYHSIQELDLQAEKVLHSPWHHHSPAVASVVTRIITKNSPGANSAQSLEKPYRFERKIGYAYRDPAYDRWSRSLAGFRKVFEVKGDEQAVTATTYWFGPCQNDAPDAQIPTAPDHPLCAEGSDDDPYKSVTGRVVRVDRAGLGVFPELLPPWGHRGIDEAKHLWTKTFKYAFAEYEGTLFDKPDRHVTFAYPSRVDTYVYDDAQPTTEGGTFSTNTGGGDDLDLPRHQEGVRKHLRKSVEYDHLGNLTKVTEEGSVLDEDSKPGDKPDANTITLYSSDDVREPADVGIRAAPIQCYANWQCKPAYMSIWEDIRGQDFDTLLRKQYYTYTPAGDLASVEAWLQGTEPLERHHASGEAVANPPSDQSLAEGMHTLASYTYDDLGNVTQVAAGPGHDGKPLSCSTIAYDQAYQHLPHIMRAFKAGCEGAALETQTVFDRGSEQAVYSVETNGAASEVRLDPFGRPIAVYAPDPEAPSGKKPTVLAATLSYSDRSPLSHVDVRRMVDRSGASTRSVTILNGLGEPILNFDQDKDSWILSSWFETDLSGRVTKALRPWVFHGDPVKTAENMKRITPPASNHSLFEIRYDAFGRQTQVWESGVEKNGSSWAVKQSEQRYFPLAVESRDAEQLKAGGPHEKAFQRVEFDGRGRAIRSLQHLAHPHDDNIVTSIEYQPTGEPKTIMRIHDGGTTYRRTMKYDTFGRLVHNQEPNTGNNWRYVWDLAGKLVGTSDARGCGKNLYYDGLGRMLGEDYSPCLASQPAYSPTNLASGEGLETLFRYDTYEPDQVSHEPGFVDDDRNALGDLVAVLDRGSHTRFNYDARGRVRQTSRQIAKPDGSGYEPHWYAQRSDYDVGDRLIRRTTGVDLPDLLMNGSSEERYTYSERGLPFSIDSSYGSIVQQATYGPDGAPNQIAYGDSLKTRTDFEYDSRRRLTRQRLYAIGGTSPAPLVHYDYHFSSYDEVGNPLVIEDDFRRGIFHPWHADAPRPQTKKMEYDDLYRLTGIGYTYKTPSGGAPWISPFQAEVKANDHRLVPLQELPTRVARQAFAYDGLGNITESSDDLSARYDRSFGSNLGYGTEANGPNQLVSGEGLKVRYDEAGNLTELKIERPGKCPDGNQSRCAQWFAYDWDEVGQLARARRWDFEGNAIPPEAAPADALPSAKPDWDLRYAYSMGGRVRKSAMDDAGETRHTLEVFDTLRLERAPFYPEDGIYKAGPEHVHAYPGGIAHVFWDTQGNLPHQASDSKVVMHLVLGDHLGSSSVIINHPTSELIEQTTYQAYGAVESDYRPERWNSFREDYKFTGKEEDIEIGATYFGARYYQPYLGRFMSADPLTVHGLGSDLNPYAYVSGRVMTNVDPLGLEKLAESSCAGFGGGAQACYEIIDDPPPAPKEPATAPPPPTNTKPADPKPAGPKPTLGHLVERGADAINQTIDVGGGYHVSTGNLTKAAVNSAIGSMQAVALMSPFTWYSAYDLEKAKASISDEPGDVSESAVRTATILLPIGKAAVVRGAGRALALHSVLKGRAVWSRVTATLRTRSGRIFAVHGPKTYMPRIIQAMARKFGYNIVKNPPKHDVHPDIKALVHAELRGEIPEKLEIAGVKFCDECRETIEAFGGKIIDDFTAVFPAEP
ncbi:MAG: RHS repeat-associated core domain-containing protein [Candidatus Binatia bacterium]